SLAVRQVIAFGAAGADSYYPALRPDADGNLHVVFTRSSAATYAGVRVTGRRVSDAPDTLEPSVEVRAGEGAQTDSSGRMGDYSGAAVDPADPHTVWVAGEYVRSTGDADWGTWIARLAVRRLDIAAGPGGTPNPVASGGTVSAGVVAVDSLPVPLTYTWSASCPTLGSAGSFDDPALASPRWTAPENRTGAPQGCTLAVTVSDGVLTRAAGYVQTVSPSTIPILTLDLDRTVFHPGDLMILRFTLSPGTVPLAVSAYVVLRLPDGSVLSLQPGGAVPGLVPFAGEFVPAPVTGELVRYRFTGHEAPGAYAWLDALTHGGGLVGAVRRLDFTVAP